MGHGHCDDYIDGYSVFCCYRCRDNLLRRTFSLATETVIATETALFAVTQQATNTKTELFTTTMISTAVETLVATLTDVLTITETDIRTSFDSVTKVFTSLITTTQVVTNIQTAVVTTALLGPHHPDGHHNHDLRRGHELTTTVSTALTLPHPVAKKAKQDACPVKPPQITVTPTAVLIMPTRPATPTLPRIYPPAHAPVRPPPR